MNCIWMGSDRPRAIRGRHLDDCADETCRGCLGCYEDHCRVCGIAHIDGACAECMAETRDALHQIARMCGSLPKEVENRGVHGEAMMLLGPAADAEARGHVEASYLAGRLPEGWIEATHGKNCPIMRNEACVGCAGDERHPLIVLASWQEVYAEEFEHELTRKATVSNAVGYLDRNLTYAATWPHVPFEDFARDLRRCQAHLEDVLHDGERQDTGAPCMNCGALLERAWNLAGEGRDGWRCPRCKQSSSEDQYRFAVAHLHREEATELTDRDMEIRTGVKAGTVRVWANRGDVRRRRDAGRTLYAVEDVVRISTQRGLVS